MRKLIAISLCFFMSSLVSPHAKGQVRRQTGAAFNSTPSKYPAKDQSDEEVKGKKKEEDKGPPTNSGDEPEPVSAFGYAYSMGPTEMGATGLFTVFDAYTIGRKEFRFGMALSRFHRDPGYLRITQLPASFTYGLRSNLELFFSTNVYQRTRVYAPTELSGPILLSALRTNVAGSSNFASGQNVNNGFFLLPGLPVSGALVGGALPGSPRGQSRAIFDPVLNRNKTAFQSPSYFNDLPFAAGGGGGYGDTVIGLKYRFKDFTPKGFVNQSSVLAYIKFPSEFAGGLLNDTRSKLFDGATSGTTDFAVFFLNSLYAYNQQKDNKAKEIINLHTNFGYIHNGDPKSGGVRLIDRKDAVISAIGTDALLNRYSQLLGEVRYTRYIGGGTPNAHSSSPVDVTIGARFFPLGMPKDVVECDKDSAPKDKLFLSFGGGYRYSFNLSSLSGLTRNNSGFIFQLGLGRSNNRSKFKKCGGEDLGGCSSDAPLSFSRASIDQATVARGQGIILEYAVVNGGKPKILYTLKLPNGKEVRIRPQGYEAEDYVVESQDTTIPIKAVVGPDEIVFRVPLTADFPAGKGLKINLTASFTAKGVNCPPVVADSQPFEVIEPPAGRPILALEPVRTRISANTARDYSVTATVSGTQPGTVSLSWRAPAEVSLSGSDADQVRSFNSATLKAGSTYPITVTASANGEADTKTSEFVVNNPPMVSLDANPSGVLARPVTRGTPINFIAKGDDADGDPLTYAWEIINAADGTKSSLGGASAANTTTVDTAGLALGRYKVRVTISDEFDTATADSAEFFVEEILSSKPSIFFGFDCYNLTKGEAKKLKAEAEWLKQDPNNLILIRAEGNADARGRDDYNLCLGCRRACEVKQYLIRHGISPDRIRIIISFGESKADPLDPYGAKNRRVDLVYIRSAQGYQMSEGQVCECQSVKAKRSRCGRNCSERKRPGTTRKKAKPVRVVGSD